MDRAEGSAHLWIAQARATWTMVIAGIAASAERDEELKRWGRDPLELTLEPGDMTRLRCRYDNPDDRTVGFGESSNDEMCFLMGFTRGEHGIGGCTLRETDSGFTPTACADVEPNGRGVGTSCTADGDECPDGLRCTAGLSGDVTDGVCIAIGCESSEECGGGATCCAPDLAGGAIKVCMPEACRPDNCAPVD